MAVINKLEVTVLPQSYFTSAEKEIARNNIGALGINEYKFDVEVSNTQELKDALVNPDVHFINVITDTCEINTIYEPMIRGDKYIHGKKIFFKFDTIRLNNYKLFFLNEACENTDDMDWQGNFYATSSDAGVYIKNLYGGANVRHGSQPGTYVYQTNSGVNTDFAQSNWVTPELENFNKVKYYNEKLNNTYDTVAANSATWNEVNEPELSCENFVEWNFTRQSTDNMLANPLLALCDTSGTPSGTLNAGDKYMLYVDGLLGQSAANNTYVNFGMQSGTTTGQYLMSEPLPSKKLCRSTSTGNDFACSFMFTVPTSGTYSVAIQPTQNSQEYKFFGNTTIRQIKIG